LIVNAGKATPLAKQRLAPSKRLGSTDLSEIFGLDMAQSASPGARVGVRKPAKPKRAEKGAAAPKGKRKPRRPAAE